MQIAWGNTSNAVGNSELTLSVNNLRAVGLAALRGRPRAERRGQLHAEGVLAAGRQTDGRGFQFANCATDGQVGQQPALRHDGDPQRPRPGHRPETIQRSAIQAGGGAQPTGPGLIVRLRHLRPGAGSGRPPGGRSCRAGHHAASGAATGHERHLRHRRIESAPHAEAEDTRRHRDFRAGGLHGTVWQERHS